MGSWVRIVGRGRDDKIASVDGIVNALHMIDVFHHETHEGEAFSQSHYRVALADSATATVLLCPNGVTAHMTVSVISEGNAYILFHESPTIKHSGTSLTPVNRHRGSSNTSKVLFHHTVSGVTSYAGTTLWSDIIPGGVKNAAVGGSGGQREEWMLMSGTTYILALRNTAGAAKNVAINFSWYEGD